MEINYIGAYDVQDLVESIGHSVVNTRPKMFKFLRATGVLDGMTPNPLLMKRCMVWNESLDITTRGKWVTRAHKVYFNSEGKQWVTQLLSHYYGDGKNLNAILQRGIRTKRGSWNPFASHHRL